MSEDPLVIPDFLRRTPPVVKIPNIPGLRGRGSPERPSTPAVSPQPQMRAEVEVVPKGAQLQPPPLASLARRINAAHKDAAGCFSESIRRAYECGRLLEEAQREVRKQHGAGVWGRWLRCNCPQISDRSVRVYKRTFKKINAMGGISAAAADLGDQSLKSLDVAFRDTTEQKRARRAEREAELAKRLEGTYSDLGQKLYGLIYMDPPTEYLPYSKETGNDRSAANQYPLMSDQEIMVIDLPAAPTAGLFCWSTVAILARSLKFAEHWGFEYKSAWFWEKDKHATGHWAFNTVEILLIATRGAFPAPAPGEQPIDLQKYPRGAHSAKPLQFRDQIAELYPNVPKLEMFARVPEDGSPPPEGWDVWGAEATTRLGDETPRAV